MKRLASAALLTTVLAASFSADSLVIFDERSSLGLTLVTTKSMADQHVDTYVGDVCIAAAELANTSGVSKDVKVRSQDAGSIELTDAKLDAAEFQKSGGEIVPDLGFKQGNDMVVRLQSGGALSILDRGEAGDNIYINANPTTPLAVNITLDPNKTTDCAPARMKVTQRKSMQELKGRTGKTMQDLKNFRTEVEVTAFLPDGTPVRSLYLGDVELDRLTTDEDGLVDVGFSLIYPIAMEKGIR